MAAARKKRRVRKHATKSIPSRETNGNPSSHRAAEAKNGGSLHDASASSPVLVGRQRGHRLDLRLALGDITEMDARAYLLGVFRDVTPAGPAAALDARLGGAVHEFASRRMFSANVGEIFVLPVGKRVLLADFVVFSGLGEFGSFSENVQQFATENAIRSCVRARIDSVGTVLLGAASGLDVPTSLRSLLRGVLAGMQSADPATGLRSLTLCEIDRERFETIQSELYRLVRSSDFDAVEVTISEAQLPPPLRRPPAAAPLPGMPAAVPSRSPVYLTVRQERGPQGHVGVRVALLTAGGGATVLGSLRQVRNTDVEALLRRIDPEQLDLGRLEKIGTALAKLVLDKNMRAALSQLRDNHLIVVQDAYTSRFPWETLHLDGWFPALRAGLSRRYDADPLSVAKWTDERRRSHGLSVLLIANPTLDLSGADAEGEKLQAIFRSHSDIRLTLLVREAATKRAVQAAIRSGDFDMIHYAGHAFFDVRDRERSGILCHDDEVLSGRELVGEARLPGLIFFNACESGRVRRGAKRRRRARIEPSVGLAEAFLRGGIGNYVGTYWEVGDEAALRFSQTFYLQLLNGRSIGAALLQGRSVVQRLSNPDWADYMLYGDHEFAVKTLTAAESRVG